MFDKSMQYGSLLLTFLLFMPGSSRADLDDMSHLEDDTRTLSASIGYRWVDTNGNANRAAEYSYLDDSETFELVYKQDLEDKHLSLMADFVNKNDYIFEGEFNYKALFRLSLMSERLYHNLDHIPYDVTLPEARQDSGEYVYQDHDVNAVYGRRISIDEVKVRAKLPNYPAHINLAVWRMEKKGHEQLRFVSEDCAGSCHIQSTTRKVDRVTEEIKAGFDAHLGPIDIAFLQTLREFKEKAANPSDSFGPHSEFFMLGRSAGDYDHDVTPDSKLSESTLMVNLSPSGGFVTAASYTIGNREKTSNISGVSPTDAETDYQKLAADVTYTPSEQWTMNFRYRMFELDSDGPSTQVTNGSTTFGGLIPVRESIDIDRSNYTAYVSYRSSHKMTIKGEFEHEAEERSDTVESGGSADLSWALPEKETTDRFRLSFYSRMMKKSALKFNGWYQHVEVDNPAYGTTLTDSNQVFLSASYKPMMQWGATGSIDLLRGDGNDRKKASENLALGMWYIPNEFLSADINYGLMNTNIDEEIEFGEGAFNIASDADYEQQVHTISVGINLRPTKIINCRMEGYHIRSKASFDPSFINTTANTATDDDLKEISEVDIRQSGLKARLSWRLSEILTAGIEYTFNDYEDRNSSVFDGTAQTVMASLTGTF